MEALAAEAKKLNIICEYAEDVPYILIGDSYRLQRILLNLTSNAIKFTQEGYVKIKIKLAKKVDDKKLVLRISIEDSGIGIPKELQINVYEKFNRLNPSNQGFYKGAGLGLSIVKQFISEMGGEIDLKSEVNIGSIFMCTLPFDLPLIDEIPLELGNE